MRVFVALPLSNSVTHALVCLMRQACDQSSEVRWVSSSNLHLTLRFLGDIPVEDVASVYDACAQAANAEALRLVVRGTGAFPSWHRPSVLWAGVSGMTASLHQLAAQVEHELVRVGFDPTDRPFRPHVTLGRCRSGCSKEVCQRLQAAGEQLHEPWLADTMVIYQSVLSQRGPRYTALGRIKLGGVPRVGEAERGKQSVD
ncbi:MAG: RNA 2',3'-cyclic phosphodiesterase [Limnochordia bacterium]|jgi:2'-5' RNA ligase